MSYVRDFGYELGFDVVESGPLVRSSYHADEQARKYGLSHEVWQNSINLLVV